jgi:hypothetical protein
MRILNLVWILLLQTPQAAQVPSPPPQAALPATAGQTVVIGFQDGMKVTVGNPEFSGFIEGRSGDALLLYRQRSLHGEMPVRTIARIEIGPYRRDKPFSLKVTLRNGDQLDVEAERRDFVSIKGRTDLGPVTIKHPDPISAPVRLSTKKPNRKKDLTIQYLEFPAS